MGGRGTATDDAPWDAGAAMGQCDDHECYAAITAGETTDGERGQRQHYALPHHRRPGMAANAAGIRAARARFNQTENLQNREAARRHIFETHKLPSEVEDGAAWRLAEVLDELKARGVT